MREELANELSRRGQWDESIDHYRKVLLQGDPTDKSMSRVHFNLAMTLAHRNGPGDMDEAMDHCRQAIRIAPNYSRSHLGLGVMYRAKGMLPEAAEEFRQAIRFQADFYEAYYMLGMVLALQHDFTEAVDVLRQAVEIYPEYETGHWGLCLALDMTGDKAGAYDEAVLALQLARRNGRPEIEASAKRWLYMHNSPN